MALLRQPVVLVWLAVSFLILVLSIFMGLFMPSTTLVKVAAVLLATFASSIFFPILVGYFYDKIKERESGGAIWQVFREFADGGILRVYKDREEQDHPENAVAHLRAAFVNHHYGDVKLIGISLRVFFSQPGPFFESISSLASTAGENPNVRLKVLLSHLESVEVINRASIETPQMQEPLIRNEIALTAANIENLIGCNPGFALNYGYYQSAPYCTLVVFPEKCFFSPNILSRVAPVRLPMIVFGHGSHGYTVLNDYFEYLWQRRLDVNGDPIAEPRDGR